ncbi:putative LysR family transcriptional regulator [Gordonia malaquae NBRC 108250]|uniref:Putative LysR family transcriptional regulator n=2 Tax=Gordonia malaquae TaxID=410332 RepID=M3VE31_GORML|nr:putative LysR family transcriptional regulator [Gordonia malaquae NBRC 108250]
MQMEKYHPNMHEWTRDFAPLLRALTALDAHGESMTVASEALGVSQSSMSRRLHALEERLSVPLLVREGRNVRLTPAARSLLDDLRRPLAEVERALERAASDGDAESGRIRFGFPLTMGSGDVPEVLAAFHHRNPHVHLQLKQAHGAELIADLRAGELDLAITIPPADETAHVLIGSQEIVVATSERHWAAQRDHVSLDELVDEVFIANPENFHLRAATVEWCASVGFAPNIAVEITEFATIRELVERGLGVALLPRAGRQTPGVVEVQVRPQRLQRDIGLAWASTIRTPAVDRLSRFIEENLPVRPPA